MNTLVRMGESAKNSGMITFMDYPIYMTTRYHSSAQNSPLGPIIRQGCSQNQPRVLPQVRSVVPIRLIWQLIDVEIDVTIETHLRAIRPDDSGIAHEILDLEGSRVVVIALCSGMSMYIAPFESPLKPLAFPPRRPRFLTLFEAR